MAIWKRVRLVLLVLVGLLGALVVANLGAEEEVESADFSGKALTGVQQVVLVEGANSGGSAVTISLFQLDADGSWKRTRGPYDGRIGSSGFRDPNTRSEGDGSTPIGVFPLTAAFGADPAPSGTRLPYTQIVADDQCWISDPASPAYNRWVRTTPCTPPNVNLFQKSREGELFHTAIVIGFNTEFRRANAGSALFFHLRTDDADGNAQATAGGVGLSEDELRSILRGLDPARNPVAVMGPTAWVISPDRVSA